MTIEGGIMSFLRQHITDEDYRRAKIAYATWATMTLLDGSRRIPDSNVRRWDDLPRADQDFIWALYQIPAWDALSHWQRDAWALGVKKAFDREPAPVSS